MELLAFALDLGALGVGDLRVSIETCGSPDKMSQNQMRKKLFEIKCEVKNLQFQRFLRISCSHICEVEICEFQTKLADLSGEHHAIADVALADLQT